MAVANFVLKAENSKLKKKYFFFGLLAVAIKYLKNFRRKGIDLFFYDISLK